MGVRDIIAHHYFDIDAEEIFHIIKRDLEPLLESIRKFKAMLINDVILYSFILLEFANLHYRNDRYGNEHYDNIVGMRFFDKT